MSERGRSAVVGGALVLLFAAPLAILALQAFADSWRAPDALPSDLGIRGFDIGFAQGKAADALFNSLVVGIGTTAACLVVGWPAARGLARRRLAGRSLI
ncbi:MAG: hypothetical protein M3331_09090, partial [Actinomycetota bacterium]|nr:hypothetical protein [Actinomycetota bacterium]